MPERLLFLTGRLASKRLAKVLEAMAHRGPYAKGR